MCDTFVALKETTATGGVLLAKNADTEVNEAQHVYKMPRRRFAEGAQVRVTHMVIPQVRETYEYVIDKSFWLYGGEIGLNEHGVAVGNEAVFSVRPSEKDGVILIDLLRLILERAATRHEAVDLVAGLLERFGQGGNCELRGNSHFDGSFIVSDRDGAVVIETAGKDWAAREVKGFGSISNGYTIGTDWDRSSLPGENGSRQHFGEMAEDRERTRCVGARERQAMSEGFLAARRGRIDVRAMADLLRYTGEGGYDPMDGEFPVRICMHAAPYPQRLWQATGALIADVRGGDAMAWVTATSGPDVSIFKPVFFGADLPDLGPMPEASYTPGAYWWQHEFLHRRAMADYHNLVPEIRADFEALEAGFFAESEAVRTGTAGEKQAFVDDCWQRAGAAGAAWIERLEKRNYFIADSAYRAMWKGFNDAASLPLGQ
jgi:dipeptidase